jgi:hypothetical protein
VVGAGQSSLALIHSWHFFLSDALPQNGVILLSKSPQTYEFFQNLTNKDFTVVTRILKN